MAEINIAPSLKRSSPSPKRKLALVLLVFALLVGLPICLIYREAHHQRLNRALITAIKAGNTSEALRLLQAGADGSARDTGSQPSTLRELLSQMWNRLLHRASAASAQQQNHHSVLLLYYETLEVHENPSKNSVLQNEKLALALLDAGAPVADQDDKGRTILEWAVIHRHSDVVRRLLAGKARVNTVDTFGKTPLRKADAEDARSLLEHGADTESKNDDGTTTLMISIDNPDERVFHWLLNQKIDVNAIGIDKNTALSIARQGQEESHEKGAHNHYVALRQLLKSRGAREISGHAPWY